MKSRLLVMTAVLSVAVVGLAAPARGQSDSLTRNYGAASPAAVRGSAPGSGVLAQATLPSFGAAARYAQRGDLPSYSPTPALLTGRGKSDKVQAEKGTLSSSKNHLNGTAVPAQAASGQAPSFAGIGFTGFIPPDVEAAAGPFHIVEAVNGRVTIFNKNGTTASTTTAAALFAPLGTPASDTIFDPQIDFDEYIGRFVILETTRNDAAARSNMMVAVSQTNDPTQGWNLFAFNARLNANTDTNNWCDYPHLGYDAQALYFTCNMFSTGGSPSFQFAKIRVMSTPQFTGGASCCFWWDFWDLREGFLGLFKVFTVQPASSHAAIPSDGEFLVAADGGGGSGSTLHVYRIPNPQNCCVPGSQTDPGLNQQDRGVGSYSSPPNAEQPGLVQSLDTGDSRLLFASSQWPRLFVSQNLADGSDSTVAYTEINFGSFPTLTTNNDWAISAGGMNRYYAGADVNAFDNKSMVYSFSNASTFAGTRWIEIPNIGVCTLCFNGEFTLRNGTNTYLQLDRLNRNRWGDYLDATRDPNGTGIWIAGEFVSALDTWGTEIGLTKQTLDVFPPFTTATKFPPANANGWNNTNLTVQLSATDTGVAGVRNITFSAAGANPIGSTTVNGSIANVGIFADGETTLTYRALDNWGNLEPPMSILVKKDTTSPTGTIVINGGASFTNNPNVNLTLSASNPGVPSDPVLAMRFSIDGGATFTPFEAFSSGKTITLPAGDGVKSVLVQYQNAAGNISSSIAGTITLDTAAPEASKRPNPSFIWGSTLTSTQVPVRISWAGSDVTSGICDWELQQSDNGGAFVNVPLSSPTVDQATVLLTPGVDTHRFRVRATDCAGNLSAFILGRTFTLTNHSENSGTITYSSGWTRVSDAGAFGGFVKLSTAAGKTATETFSGSAVAWVARKGPAAGVASVQVDGGSIANVNLNAASVRQRRIVFTKGGLSVPGSHSVKVTNLGAGGTTHEVNVDSFLLLS